MRVRTGRAALSRLVIVLLLVGCGGCALALAQDLAEQPAPAVVPPAAPPPELVVVGKSDALTDRLHAFRYRLGETLEFYARGELAARVAAELAKPPEGRRLQLYLNGVRMSGLPVRQLDGAGGERFGFSLVRDSNAAESRQAWDAFFDTRSAPDQPVRASVAVGEEPARAARSAQPLTIIVAEWSTIMIVFWGCLIALPLLFVLAVRATGMLKDRDTGYYSLGKSQMAFWGLLVFLSFFGIWIVTGTMERIPPQTLVLLGISGATGLGSMFIGAGSNAGIQKRVAEIRLQLPPLEQELTRLSAQKQSLSFTDADEARLQAISAEIEALRKALRASAPRGFWYDIMNDGDGLSFHRAQVVVWTLALGAVFVRDVMAGMSMPEFDETLLVLMGISNATYLGFKFPERAA